MPPEPLEHIAYVEDDADIQEVAQIALETIGGFRTDVYSSGLQFLGQVEATRPQLVLLDVMMPEMTGPEVLAALRGREETTLLPVIFMTAKVQGQERDHYLKLGAAGIIAKPFDPLELATEVRRIWNSL